MVSARQPVAAAPGTRLNNIAELRLLFAASVVFSHAFTLLAADRFLLIRIILNSEAAVQGFFILSGYLVFGSYDRLREPLTFYRRRLLRIYPGYLAAVLLFSGLAIVQALLAGERVEWGQLPRFAVANLTALNFLQPQIGGVFASNPLNVINGALWSIKVELMFYALVPILFYLARRFSFGLLAAAMIVVGTSWWPALQLIAAELGRAIPVSFKFQLPGQLHFFGLGIALFAHVGGNLSRARLLVLLGATAVMLLLGAGPRDALQAMALVAIIGVMSALPQARDIFRNQDISYGIYLCHFPIIQLLIAAGAANWPLGAYLTAVVLSVLAYGVFSWRFIEGPALRWRWGAR